MFRSWATQVLFLFVLCGTRLSSGTAAQWLMKGTGIPTAALIQENAVYISTDEEVLIRREVESADLRWRHILPDRHQKIVTYWAVSKAILVLVENAGSLVGHLIDYESGALLSVDIICDGSIAANCKDCSDESFKPLKSVENVKIVRSCREKQVHYDLQRSSSATDKTSVKLFPNADFAPKPISVGSCVNHYSGQNASCIVMEDKLLVLLPNNNVMLKKSGNRESWSKHFGSWTLSQFSVDDESQVLVDLQQNDVSGIDLKTAEFLWEMPLHSVSEQSRSRIVGMRGESTTVVLQPADSSAIESLTILSKTGNKTGESRYSAKVEQVTLLQGTLNEPLVVVLTSDGNTAVPASGKRDEDNSTVFSLRRGLVWIRQDGSCHITGIRNGKEIWRVKTPNCERVIEIKKSVKPKMRKLGTTYRRTAFEVNSFIMKAYRHPLVAVWAQGSDYSLLLILNGVTGAVLDVTKIFGLDATASLLVTEHRVLLSVWNSQAMEQELHILELFETTSTYNRMQQMKDRTLAGNTRKIKQDQLAKVKVLRTNYVVPSRIKAITISDARSEATEKSVLLGSETGQVYVFPLAYLSPRFVTNPAASRSPVLTKSYRPVLPILAGDSERFTYLKESLPRLNNLMTSPLVSRGSAVHLVASGLDLFHTTIAPSGDFDHLSEAFNRPGVVITVLVLSAGTAVARMFARQNQIHQEWG